MMHINAKKWQECHGTKTKPTKDRPCDWCGEELGEDGIFIHKECGEKERDLYFDLFY